MPTISETFTAIKKAVNSAAPFFTVMYPNVVYDENLIQAPCAYVTIVVLQSSDATLGGTETIDTGYVDFNLVVEADSSTEQIAAMADFLRDTFPMGRRIIEGGTTVVIKAPLTYKTPYEDLPYYRMSLQVPFDAT